MCVEPGDGDAAAAGFDVAGAGVDGEVELGGGAPAYRPCGGDGDRQVGAGEAGLVGRDEGGVGGAEHGFDGAETIGAGDFDADRGDGSGRAVPTLAVPTLAVSEQGLGGAVQHAVGAAGEVERGVVGVQHHAGVRIVEPESRVGDADAAEVGEVEPAGVGQLGEAADQPAECGGGGGEAVGGWGWG